MSKKHHIIPIFVPHRGCPHGCVFCNQKKITGLGTDVTKDQVKDTIESYLKTIPSSNEILEIAFFGGSFTGIKKEIQRELLSVAKDYKDRGLVENIRLSTRPDYISEDILTLLKENGVNIIELGVQSLDEEVLEKSYRGHTAKEVYKAVELIKGFGFKLGLQMMVGLPKDTKDRAISTATKIAKLKPDFVRIYPTLVIKDTYLEKMYLDGEYFPLSLDNTVDICCDILMIFNYKDIPVIRLGLQPTDNVSLEEDVVAGPFHPSVRQLVESKVYQKILEMFFDRNNIEKKEIVFRVNNKEISNFVGQKARNKEFLKKNYGFGKIKIIGQNISNNHFYIEAGGIQYKVELKKYLEEYIFKYLKN